MTDLDKARERRCHAREADRFNDRALAVEEMRARQEERSRSHLLRINMERVAAQVRAGKVESTWAYRRSDRESWSGSYESEEAALQAAKTNAADTYWGEPVPDEIEVAQLFPVVTRRFKCKPAVDVTFEEVEDE